jgi:hypothetical protein
MNLLKTTIAFTALTLTIFTNAQAEVRCMPKALDYVLNEFQHQRDNGGVVVRDVRNHNAQVNLGSDLQEGIVEIKDISKNSYNIRINLRQQGDEINRSVLQTNISIDNYESCIISDRTIIFNLFPERRSL